MTHEREEAWVAYWEGDANTHNYKRDVERAFLGGYDAREAAPAVPPVSKILGNCDNAHLVMPHTKCNECLNWKPEAAPAVPETKPTKLSVPIQPGEFEQEDGSRFAPAVPERCPQCTDTTKA
jgi:hypothetical protein